MSGVGTTNRKEDEVIDHRMLWARTDSVAQCRAVIGQRLLVLIASLTLIAGLLYATSLLVGSILTDITPVTLGFALALIIVFTWPVAILTTFAISATYIVLYAISTLRENKFPKHQWRVPSRFYYQQYIDRHLHAAQVQQAPFGASILGNEEHLSVEGMFTVPIGRRHGSWYRVTKSGRNYNVLRIETPHSLPSTIINSHIEQSDTLPLAFSNGSLVHANPELDKYFTITTIHGASKEVRQLLAVNVLWELLVNVDGCDVELRDTHIDFVWDEGVLSDAVIDGRIDSVKSFLEAFLHGHRHDTAHENDYLIARSPDGRILNSIESLMAISGTLTTIIVIATMVIASGYYDAISDVLAFGAIAIILGGLVSVCLSVTLAMLITAFRSVGKTHYMLATAKRIRQYALYYELR